MVNLTPILCREHLDQHSCSDLDPVVAVKDILTCLECRKKALIFVGVHPNIRSSVWDDVDLILLADAVVDYLEEDDAQACTKADNN